MLKTEYGLFDGDKWEQVCQICFKQKFEKETYFEIKATPGDYGIEGFTRSGKVFQCYCPDENYTRDELYEKQRDKITDDLKKLKKYESQLKRFLGETLISNWYFVTPEYSRNDIVAHCTKKRDEIKSLNLTIIDNENFEVIPWDIDNLKPFITTALGVTQHKVDIIPGESTTDDEKLKWKDSQISLVENAQRKHRLRFSEDSTEVSKRVDKLTDTSVKHFLDGTLILKYWENDYPEDYEKFVRLISIIEEEVKETCYFPTEDNNERLKEFKTKLYEKLSVNFPYLEETMISNLVNRVIADWILRCPIDFE